MNLKNMYYMFMCVYIYIYIERMTIQSFVDTGEQGGYLYNKKKLE